MKMWIYIVRRLLLLIPVIVGVMTITFGIYTAIPVEYKLISHLGPSKSGYSPCLSGTSGPTCVKNPAYWNGIHQLGLDRPVPVQWALWMGNALTLNWGTTDGHSYAATQLLGSSSLPVVQVLSWFVPYTLELAALSLILILALAIPIGNYSAVYRNRPLDQGARVMSFSGFALPGFLLASLALMAATFAAGGFQAQCNSTSTPFFQWYGSWPPWSCVTADSLRPSWIGPYLQTTPTGFPTVDALYNHAWGLAWESVKRMLIPALVIAYGSIAAILRFVRNSMLEVMNLDFVRTARSKGVPEAQVVRRHAGRNSLNVTVTVLGLTFAYFIGGFPIIEEVFHLQGIGLILAYSILPTYDFGLIFGTTLLFTIIVVSANIVVDILYAYLDPRVRLG